MSLKAEIRAYVKSVGKAILEEAKTYADSSAGSSITFNVTSQELNNDIDDIINTQTNDDQNGGN